jgi:AAA domain
MTVAELERRIVANESRIERLRDAPDGPLRAGRAPSGEVFLVPEGGEPIPVDPIIESSVLASFCPSCSAREREHQALVGDPRLLDRLYELRGWKREAIEDLGLGLDGDRVTFPIRDGNGRPVGRLRYAPDPARSKGQPKMIADPGSTRELFPAPEVYDGGVIWIVEGEPDAVALHSLGFQAVAIPGAGKWRPEWVQRFRRFGRAVLVPDCDDPGHSLMEEVALALLQVLEVRVIDLASERDDGFDVGDLLVEAVQAGGWRVDELAEWLEVEAEGAEPVRVSARPVGGRVITSISASRIRAKRVHWLWHDRIPLGGLTLMAGVGGLGKSTGTHELAARATRGELDGALEGEPATVLIVTLEDVLAQVSKPRLIAANADLGRVRYLTVQAPVGAPVVTLPDDLDSVECEIAEHDVRLLIVDPVVAALSGKLDAHKDHHIRRALAPLAQLTERCDLAALAVTHLNKSQAKELLGRVSGSVGFVNAARSVLALARDPDDPQGEQGCRRILVHAKANWGKYAPSLACHVETRWVHEDGEKIETSRLVIDGERDVQPEDLVNANSGNDRMDREVAAEWLTDHLADGQRHPSEDVKKAAKAADISMRTLHRARKVLPIEVDKHGFPPRTHWRLTSVPPPRGTDAGTDGWHEQETPANGPESEGPGVQSCQPYESGTDGGSGASMDEIDRADDPDLAARADAEQERFSFGGHSEQEAS